MARNIYKGNDTDVQFTVTDRYGAQVNDATISATLLDPDGNPVVGVNPLVPAWDDTLQLAFLTILGSVSVNLDVGAGYVLNVVGTGGWVNVIAMSIPCVVTVKQG